MLAGRNLLSPSDFTAEELDELFALADDIIDRPDQYRDICRGKLLATLFFEPSTRTRLSFEAAMHRLGGSVFGFSDAGSSSATKGETVEDTIRMISCYADVAVMRHHIEGAPQAAALYTAIPLINAGDGGHQHPTQTLTDLYTIRTAKGRLHDLTIGLCGDLKFGRTVHSLIEAMGRYTGITFYCISPRELVLPDYVIEQMDKNPNITYTQVERMEDCLDKLDVLYMTRVQGERFADKDEYLRLRDCYILDPAKMALAKEDTIVLHPLPRVNEITPEIDADKRAYYFTQAQYGMYVRMALLVKLLGAEDPDSQVGGAKWHRRPHAQLVQPENPDHTCPNPKCITNAEPGLPRRFEKLGSGWRCRYCDSQLDR